MVTKKDIKGLGFNKIEQVFDYIMDHLAKNDTYVAHSTIKKFSQRQVNQFETYLSNDCPFHWDYIAEARTILKFTRK